MILRDSRNQELMKVRRIERDGSNLVINGLIFGSMPIQARLAPSEVRAALKLLGPRLLWFLLTMPFRRG